MVSPPGCGAVAPGTSSPPERTIAPTTIATTATAASASSGPRRLGRAPSRPTGSVAAALGGRVAVGSAPDSASTAADSVRTRSAPVVASGGPGAAAPTATLRSASTVGCPWTAAVAARAKSPADG